LAGDINSLCAVRRRGRHGDWVEAMAQCRVARSNCSRRTGLLVLRCSVVVVRSASGGHNGALEHNDGAAGCCYRSDWSSLGFASASSHLPESRSGYSALGSDPRCTSSVSSTRCPPFVVTSSSSVLERRCSLQVLLSPSLREDLLMIHSTASVTYADEFPMNLVWLRAYLPK
jgi:hypothetical protein